MYQDLLDMERKLDWTMTRKRVEVQDALSRNPTVCLYCVFYLFFSADIYLMFRQHERCASSSATPSLGKCGKPQKAVASRL